MAGDDNAQHAASRPHRDLCDLKASQVTTVASAKVSFGFIFVCRKKPEILSITNIEVTFNKTKDLTSLTKYFKV